MSHYAVLVINSNGINDVESQLAPFDENTEMPRYSKGEVSQDELDSFVEHYTEKDESLKGLSVQELYEMNGESWNGGCWEFAPNGKAISYSTYNPNSKWDWYEVGGRWGAMLKVKEGVVAPPPNFSWGWSEEQKAKVINDNRTDQASKGGIDWEGMIDGDKFDKALRFWELYVDGEEPKNEEEKEMIKHVFYKKQYFIEFYGDKVTYAKSETDFSTFAVLKDGEWFEKGEMGWFGMSSESGEESKKWDDEFFELFIKDLSDKALLTVVDCHI